MRWSFLLLFDLEVDVVVFVGGALLGGGGGGDGLR
jgi:hypothetical protein